jgi:hypothetical protein
VTVMLVDWLGRGGIAQTTEAWVHELGACGHDLCVVTRGGRELGEVPEQAARVDVVEATGPLAIAAHRAVVAAGADAIRARHPQCVVIQNYVIPALEEPLWRAARETGARIVFVVHDHRPHSMVSGFRVGLRPALGRADVVVAHSDHVGTAVTRMARRAVELVPHPMQVGMLGRPGGRAAFTAGHLLLGVHFGTLQRHYKGSDIVANLAGTVPGWQVGAVGTGAPRARRGLETHPGWISSPDLVATVAAADAAILPYRRATQSGAVVLAQAVDGMLLEPNARDEQWRAALGELTDDEYRKKLATSARARVEAAHLAFARAVQHLVS